VTAGNNEEEAAGRQLRCETEIKQTVRLPFETINDFQDNVVSNDVSLLIQTLFRASQI
jgi:hypothetical protein